MGRRLILSPQTLPDIPYDSQRGEQAANISSFKDKLLASELMVDIVDIIQINLENPSSPPQSNFHQPYGPDQANLMLEDTPSSSVKQQTTTISLAKGIKEITLISENRSRMYTPWKFSMIVKLIGKRIPHQYLKEKITKLWKPIEPFPLIDLGHDFFIVKFSKENNMTIALHNGPWFINEYFLSTKQWEPNFMVEKAK